MSASIWQWPALNLQGPLPQQLEVERAVWGKVHGAASDFRWIAHSEGMNLQGRCLELELLLGPEDAPESATFWRALGTSYCALSCYPSRAVDAARRSGFLEKQLLEWTPSEEAPAALGALLLLPRVAGLGDEVWWDKSDNPDWTSPSFSLTLEPGEARPTGVTERVLAQRVESGCAALREAVEEPALASFYSSLFAKRRPAVLAGLSRPLPPEAVAALLLPLDREQADRLSIAGWAVSSRIDPESFSRLWDVLLCDRAPAGLRAVPQSDLTARGKAAARAIFAGYPCDASPLASPAVRTPAAKASQAVERLLDFVADEGKRWLRPEDLGGGLPLRFTEDEALYLEVGVEQVQGEAAKLNQKGGVFYWKGQQLLVKADLLRAASLALAPSTSQRLGFPQTRRVPALLFCPRLDEKDWDELVPRLGKVQLEGAIEQSLSCEPNLFGDVLRNWLRNWRQRTRKSELASILDRHLS